MTTPQTTCLPAARHRGWLPIALGGGLVLLLAACNGPGDGGAAAGASAPAGGGSAAAAAAPATGASAPPVSVTLVRAQQRDLPVRLATTGTVAPLSSVDVRPQVSTVVTRVHIREGQFVRKGELLFTLDARTDEANVAKAQAQLARDQAALADAQRQLARSKELLAQNFISQNAVDTNQTLVDSQAAAVAADRAAVEAARVGLSYARITAPGSGRAGVITVFPGSAVQANQTTLVTITQLDPISVAFNLPQRQLPDALTALKNGGAAVDAKLPEGAGTLSGKLQFVDNAVDAASGTVKVKAVFANPDGKLWPGAFVNVSMTVRVLKDAVVIPQAALIQSARGTIVYTVKEGSAAPRPVKVLYAEGEDAAVEGVKPGERIVLDGRQNVRPGSSVVERQRDAAGKPGGAASGARGASAPGGGAPAAGGPGASGAAGAIARSTTP